MDEEQGYECEICKRIITDDKEINKMVFTQDLADNHLYCKDCAKKYNIKPGWDGPIGCFPYEH